MGGTKFDISGQLHSHTFMGLGNPDHIESLPYVQDILAYGCTLSSHKNELLRIVRSGGQYEVYCSILNAPCPPQPLYDKSIIHGFQEVTSSEL